MLPFPGSAPTVDFAFFKVEEESFWFQHRNRVIGTLVSNFPPPRLFFNVGGGNGVFAMELQRLGVPTVLVEPGPDGARNAKQRGVNREFGRR